MTEQSRSGFYDKSLVGYIEDIFYDEERQAWMGRLVPLPGREINIGDEYYVTIRLDYDERRGEKRG